MSVNNITLAKLRSGKTGRFSSWDTSGRNADAWTIPARSSRVLADIEGPGVITHIWMTQGCNYRECLLKITWDDAPAPSVLCPLGDFFGLGHGIVNSYQSLLFSASTNTDNKFNQGCALNCYVPMPFRKRAVVELINETDADHGQYFYIDYEQMNADELDELGYFHAEFRRACPFQGWAPEMIVNQPPVDIPNLEHEAWENNYVILETKGRGHYLGCNLSVTNIQGTWWGEGDDMIWVDGYKWPPDLHGTGSEDYLNQAWEMQPNAFLRNGSSIHEVNTGGYQTSYVHHLENPVRFQQEIKVTIEHGHANHLGNEMSSVAYWYADAPSRVIDPPPVAKRMPVRKVDNQWVISDDIRWPGKPVAIDQAVLENAREKWVEHCEMMCKKRLSDHHSLFIREGWQLSPLMPCDDVMLAPYHGLDEDFRWELLPHKEYLHLVEVHNLRGPNGIVYLARKVRVAEDGEWVLHVGHDGGVRVFVDGRPVAATGGTVNPAPYTRTQVRVALAEGEHEIVVALDRAGGLGWGIFVSFETTETGDDSGAGLRFPEPS